MKRHFSGNKICTTISVARLHWLDLHQLLSYHFKTITVTLSNENWVALGNFSKEYKKEKSASDNRLESPPGVVVLEISVTPGGHLVH